MYAIDFDEVHSSNILEFSSMRYLVYDRWFSKVFRWARTFGAKDIQETYFCIIWIAASVEMDGISNRIQIVQHLNGFKQFKCFHERSFS